MSKYTCEDCHKDFEAYQPMIIVCEECFNTIEEES